MRLAKLLGTCNLGSFGWAFVALVLCRAFNIEIFRAGIEAVPKSTVGGRGARLYAIRRLPPRCPAVGVPISLPAFNNNLVNLLKTTTISYAIAAPERCTWQPDLVRQRHRARDDERGLLVYLLLVGALVWGMGRRGRAMKLLAIGR